MASRKDIIVSEAFMNYVNAVSENNVEDALRKNTRRFRKLLRNIPKKKINYAYAEGKWTLKELLQHIVDAERVFVFRALHFSRKDNTPLPGFDENVWAITAKAPKRSWGDLIDEFTALRASTELYFQSLDEDQLTAGGTANGKASNVLGLGFVCAGHVAHHMNIIKERYLNEYPAKKKKDKKKFEPK
ncbi:DinB family protein [Paraflavitalea sp. CAU 1676]|uniref:DinB family protein n=1 Tax=Paraflavitalea sp. CAU 1676 TaxID=3032598 RepID=UPI0023DA7841|nr:DinB family protein [Paraflavitalea sp. CAU 1676]MDF2192634.1 DinB family protein [Paraflavitalea sp. CAU 1676]